VIAVPQLFARWNALPRSLRLVASIAALAALTFAVAALFAAHTVRIALFAAPLHPDQIGEVEERLAAWSVPFTPVSDNVLVDAARRSDLLLRLSLAGTPHPHLSSTGEALATVGVLTPQAVVDAQARAGLAGDIEAGLRGIDGVDDARVIIAPAKASEFADESAHRASASVRLRLRPGAQLTRETIGGIRAFVAASVPELEPARVTILDDRGLALADAGAADDAARLQHSLQSALDAAFGEGATIVRVRAEYAMAQTSERDLRRSPAAAESIAVTRTSETYENGAKRYRRQDEANDRGSETHESFAQLAPGSLKRLSTAVFVDQSRALDLTKVRELCGATLGYDPNRGDDLAVEAVDFHRETLPRRNGWWLVYGAILPLAPALILAIGFVACARLAVPPIATLLNAIAERANLERASKAAVSYPPARVRSMLEQEPPHAAAAIISALPAATATAVLELYPPHEREAIVDRMQRRHSPLLSDPQELLRRHV